MTILFMGTPDFAVPSLEALIAAGHTICGVFTQPDRPKNRGMKLQAPPVKRIALAHDIPVFQPVTLKDGTALEEIRQLSPELIVVAAYGRLLPRKILELPAKGCINVHSSLLPKYRGAAPINWAVLNGEEETGVTIMYMAQELDAGDIIAQASTPIDPEETVESVHDRLAGLGARLLVQTVSRLEARHHPFCRQTGHPGRLWRWKGALLDRSSGAWKSTDVCGRLFERTPCFGGRGLRPIQKREVKPCGCPRNGAPHPERL